MTSARQIRANRANARAATGPKSAAGKARASINARWHGLSLSIHFQPALSAEAETLAHKIAGEEANAAVLESARRVAEAQIDIARVRSARHELFVRMLNDQHYAPKKSLAAFPRKRRMLRRIIRIFGPDTALPPDVADMLRVQPVGLDRFKAILSDVLRACILIDRYERRARSRRKFAIRELDLARREIDQNKMAGGSLSRQTI